jgi:hypothetical protein
MPFIVESIPDIMFDEMPAYLVYSDRLRKIGMKCTWARNRENDAIFVQTNAGGGSHDGTEKISDYVLIWKEQYISVRASQLPATHNESGVESNWKVSDVRIPEVLAGDEYTVHSLIKEAMSADCGRYKKVNVVFKTAFMAFSKHVISSPL